MLNRLCVVYYMCAHAEVNETTLIYITVCVQAIGPGD